MNRMNIRDVIIRLESSKYLASMRADFDGRISKFHEQCTYCVYGGPQWALVWYIWLHFCRWMAKSSQMEINWISIQTEICCWSASTLSILLCNRPFEMISVEKPKHWLQAQFIGVLMRIRYPTIAQVFLSKRLIEFAW